MNQACHYRRLRLLLPVVWFALLAGGTTARAALPPLDPPEVFFTNLADRLLQQQLGLRLTEIQVAPTNQYEPAVHRLFQVTANLYDATSTNEFPAVFRPWFEVRSNGVFLAGFTNDNRASTVDAWLETNPYGLPMVIAARPGFPNFNEFTLRSDVLVQRKLQITRTAPPRIGIFPNATNQMYVVGLSNFLGVEAWNSHDSTVSGPYPRAVTLSVSNLTTLWMSNDLGWQTGRVLTASATTNIAAGWLGGIMRGFAVPMATNQGFLSNAVYRFANNTFDNTSTNAFETNMPGFPLPYWILAVSNRLQVLMTDGGRLIDFVLLDAMQSTDLHQRLVGGVNPFQAIGGVSATMAGVWNTNRLLGPSGPTEGIRRQMDISLGNITTSLAEWRSFTLSPTLSQGAKDLAIDMFRVFWGFTQLTTNLIQTNSSLAMVAPFNPAARLAIATTWQANDPLIHHRASDLNYGPTSNYQYLRPNQPATNIAPSSLGRLNSSYSPWSGNPLSSNTDPSAHDRSVRDPHVYGADDWDFPVNTPLAPGWLGRVHRGTPWQTLYLKADAAPLFTWLQHSPEARTHPTNDWRLVALIASLFNTNDPRALTSVNTTSAAVWAATFSGLTVLSNSLSNPTLFTQLQFDIDTITAASPQLAPLVDGISRHRTAQPGQYFAEVAGFLAVPELSSASPWLNLADFQPSHGLNDEAYELLPSQLLALVRADPVVLATRAGPCIELRCQALDGYAYRVEGSASLTNWVTVSEPHFPTNGTFTLTTPATNGPQFFRAVWLP